MPKVKWGIDPDEPEDLEQFDVYDGPPLPTGVYQGNITRLTVKKNKNDDDMFNGLFVVDESPEDGKDKFNGATLWFNQNITQQGSVYIKQWLKAMGLSWADFRDRTVLEDSKDRPTKVLKIGSQKFNDGVDVPVRVQVGMSKSTPEYPEKKPEIKSFLLPRDAEDEWDADADADAGSSVF